MVDFRIRTLDNYEIPVEIITLTISIILHIALVLISLVMIMFLIGSTPGRPAVHVRPDDDFSSIRWWVPIVNPLESIYGWVEIDH